MVHIATVHWRSDRWIDVQLRYLNRNVDEPYRVYAWLDQELRRHAHEFFYATDVPLKLARQGIQTVQTSYKDLGLPTYSNALFCTRKYAEKNREALIGYLRATIKGWEMNARDPKLGARLTVEDYGANLGLKFDEELQKNEVQIPLTQSELTKQKGLLWVDRDYIAGPIYTGLKAIGRTNLPPVEKFVDTTLLAEAYGGKTSLLS